MPSYEIRYEKPPHAIGIHTIVANDEFDARIYAEDHYGDTLLSVNPRTRTSHFDSPSSDGRIRGAGRISDALRALGQRIGMTDPQR